MGPVGGKGRPSVGKVGEWYVESWRLQVYSLRLCQLRTDGLAPVSKYWTYRLHVGVMGLVSLVAWCQQWVPLPPLLQWLAQERNWVRTRGSVSRRAVDCVENPFSQEQWLCPSLLMTSRKVAMHWPHEIRMVWDHMRTERGMCVVCWSVFPLQGVYRFESPRLSDMSITCCGSHHVDHLTNLMSLFVINVCCLIHLIVCISCTIRVGCTFLLKWFE
jgi:hypothetical protein